MIPVRAVYPVNAACYEVKKGNVFLFTVLVFLFQMPTGCNSVPAIAEDHGGTDGS